MKGRGVNRGPCVLPLNKQERKKYVVIPSFWLTPKDRRNLGLFSSRFLPTSISGCYFAAIDYLLYSLIFSMSKHFQSLPGLEVHLKLHRQVGALKPSHLIIPSCLHVSCKRIVNIKERQCLFPSWIQCLAWSLECRKTPQNKLVKLS